MSPANIDLTAKKLAEQKRKRNAAWKNMNESAGTVKASDKATKYRLPTKEELEASKKQQKQKKELSPKAKDEKPAVVDKNATRKITVERYTPPEEENIGSNSLGQLYDLTSKGEIIKTTTEEEKKLNTYKQILGEDVWLSDKELYEDGSAYNIIASASQANSPLIFDANGPVAPGVDEANNFMFSQEYREKKKKEKYEAAKNSIGYTKSYNANNYEDIDYSSMPDGNFIISNLPTLQNEWTIEKGEISKNADAKAGIDTKSKALSNGKVFLNFGENQLTKKMDLLAKAKKEGKVSEIKKLELEISSARKDLGLNNKIYDENTGELLSVKQSKDFLEKQNAKATQLANDSNYNALNDAQTNSYYQLIALSKKAIELKDSIFASESNIEKIGSFWQEYLTPKGEGDKGYYQDMRYLAEIAKTGKLPEGLNELPGSHPVAKAFNKKLQEYVTLSKAIELNADPVTSEKNYRIVNFLDDTAKAFTNQGIYSATGWENKREAAIAFNEALKSVGFEYSDKEKLEEATEKELADLALEGTAHLLPLVASLALTKKLTGPQLTQASNIASAFSTKVFGNSRAMKTATDIFLGGVKEVAVMAGGDAILDKTTGAPPTDSTFAFSLGVGNVVAGKLIQKMVTNKTRFVTPILASLSKSKTASQIGGATLGATTGTVVMNIAERATLIKDQLLAQGKLDQAAQWEELSNTQHVASTFGSLLLLGGFAPKRLMDNLRSDIKAMPIFDYESSRAGTLLGIDGKVKVSKGIEAQKRNEEIALAEEKSLEKLNDKYKDSEDFESMAKEEVAIKKAANVLRGNVDIQVAKANIAEGLTEFNATDMWVASNKIKYGENLSGSELEMFASNPIELIANQLGLKKGTPLYETMANYQRATQFNGEILDALKIFAGKPERQPLLKNMFEQSILQGQIKSIEASIKENPSAKAIYEANLSELQKKSDALNNEQINLTDVAMARLSRDITLDIEATIKNAKANGKEVIVYEGENANKNFIKADEASGSENKLKAGEIAYGFVDLKGNIHLNKEAMEFAGKSGTGTHETGHLVLRNWMKDAKGNLTDEGVKFVEDFLESLSPKELEVVTRIVETEGDYKFIESKDSDGKIKIAETPKNEYYEEYLAAYTEAIKTGELSKNSKSLEGFRAKLNTALKKAGILKGDVLPGEEGIKEMSAMLTSLAESSKKGEASQSGIEFANKQSKNENQVNASNVRSKAKVEEVQKKIDKLEKDYDEDIIDYDEYESKLSNYEKELERAKLIPETKTVEVAKPVVKEINTIEALENEAKEVIKENKGKIASDKVQAAYNAKGLEAAMEIIDLFKPITKALVNKRRDAPGFEERLLTDEIETGEGGILDLIRKYDPENGTPLAAYINKYLPVRAITASRRVLDKDFSKDVGEEKGLMSTETAEQSFENTVEEKPKYKSLLEQDIVESSVVESVKNKVLTTLRTVKSRLDAPVSINKTITPIISEIKDAMGKQADIDLKTAMGGKKDNQLRSWLLKNKKATLENMTTTWLMGANGVGGIPQAIQKRINGKWVNYPEWVDKKIDRESVSTDLAGRTSGAELARRMPNAVNLVSDADYLGQFLEPSGNPIRGRKESLAKATAEEIAFDIIAKDFAEEGPLFEALVTNQERQGVSVGDAMAIDIIRQIERGNVKRSKIKGESKLIADAKEDFFKHYNKLEGAERAKINDFILGRLNLSDDEIANDGTLQVYLEKARSLEGARGKSLGSVTQRRGSMSSIELLDGLLNKVKKSSTEEILGSIKEFLRAELKSFKTSSGNFVTTNKDYLTYVLDPALRKALGSEAVEKLYNEGSLGIKEKVVSGQLRTYITINGEVFTHNKPISEIKSDFREANTVDKVKKAIDVINSEAIEQQKYVFDTLEYYKEKNMIEKGKDHIDLLAVDMLGAIRKMSKMGFWVRGLKSKESRLEHNTTINDLKAELKRFLEDPNMTRKELKDFADKMRINLIPLVADQAFTDAGLKFSGIDRHLNPEFLEAMIPFRKQMRNIKELYGSEERLDKLMDNAKGAKQRRLDREKEKADINKTLYSKTKKGITVLDFDDTLAKTKSNVLFTMPDGEKGKLNAEEFAKEGQAYLDRGAAFDFSEFSKVNEGSKGPMFDRAMELYKKFGNNDVYVLTARPSNSDVAIQEFLKAQGLDLKIENIVGLGNSAAKAKADWITSKAAEGYNDFYFSDDAVQNVKAVKDVLSALDVKSDVQLAKVKYSKTKLAEDLSSMIERKKGIPVAEEISAAKASIIGKNKGKFKFFLPPNAEDFAGLLYKFYGKGEQGNADMKLMKEALLDPYERGENAISTYRQKIATDLKAMDTRLNKLGGEVSKESKEALKKSGFDADQATRVYIWNKQGIEIPDITKDEVKELSSIVKNDDRLRLYADGVMELVDFPAPTDSWYASNLKYDLYKHSTEGVRKDFLAPWKENMDAMFTPENYNRMEAAYGKDFVDNFKQLTNRMETGKARPENIGKIAAKGLDWINGSVGVIMWMNTRSAVLQTISAVNYINWKDNNLFAAGKTLTKPVEFAKTFKELMNSDFLKQRRSGLEINIEDAEIAKAIEKGGNAPERLFGKLIKAGFKPTQIADSFAIAIGGTPFYMNRTKTYQKEVIIDKDGNSVRKYTDAEAKQKAFDDFRALSEEHQQSSRQDRVSNVQLGVLGRLIFAFNNTPMQMTRLQKKAALDIINGRGDAKTNVSKLVYYGLVQSAIFYALQQGAFGMLFGKDEDELKEGEAEYLAKKKEAKVVKMANGMIDSFISGSGMTGKLMVTAKNTLLKYQSESEKGYNASTADIINEGLSVSPPFSSKTKKIASAFKEIKYADTKKGKIKAEKTGILNSPNTIAGSKLIAVGTNIPIDRFLNKINNVATVVSDENVEDWQRIALALGWDKYSLGMYEDPYLDPTEQAAADALTKKQASEAAKITRDAKKAEEKAAYDALPQKSKDSLEYIKFKKSEDKSKKKFIDEEVRKSKLTPEQLEYEKYLAREKRAKSKAKSKATKLRNQKLKDSINYANTQR
jgi:hypothetical protein